MLNVVRWTPQQIAARRNSKAVDTLFDDLWNSMWEARETARPALVPPMDVVENNDAVTIHMDLPGINPDDVTIEVNDGLLTISGELVQDVNSENKQVAYRERRHGTFKRSVQLSDTLDSANANATFENGVLTLVLPKRPEAQPRRITVQHG